MRARRLRKNMGVSEKVLWHYLRHDRQGFRFRRQFAVGPYFLDFYCPECKLAVEVDGPHHELRADKDRERDAWLDSVGIGVLRLPSLDLFTDDGVASAKWVEMIGDACEGRAGREFYVAK